MIRSKARFDSPGGAHGTARRDRPILESLEQAKAQNLKRIEALVDREPEIAAALEACRDEAPCALAMCAICYHRHRFGTIRELLPISKSCEDVQEFATIHLETAPGGALAGIDIKGAHGRLRKRLHRSGFAGSLLVGGTETAWLARDSVWVLHAHLLAIGVAPDAWAALDQKLADSGRADPLHVVDLNNPERQVSYALKFVTYHRPGKIGPDGRAKAYPLPRARLAELAAWSSRYRLDQFLFLFGARRRGGRIVPEFEK